MNVKWRQNMEMILENPDKLTNVHCECVWPFSFSRVCVVFTRCIVEMLSLLRAELSRVGQAVDEFKVVSEFYLNFLYLSPPLSLSSFHFLTRKRRKKNIR